MISSSSHTCFARAPRPSIWDMASDFTKQNEPEQIKEGTLQNPAYTLRARPGTAASLANQGERIGGGGHGAIRVPVRLYPRMPGGYLILHPPLQKKERLQRPTPLLVACGPMNTESNGTKRGKRERRNKTQHDPGSIRRRQHLGLFALAHRVGTLQNQLRPHDRASFSGTASRAPWGARVYLPVRPSGRSGNTAVHPST